MVGDARVNQHRANPVVTTMRAESIRVGRMRLCLLALGPTLLASDSAFHGSVLTLAAGLLLLVGWLTNVACPANVSTPVRQVVGLVVIAAAVAAFDMLLQARSSVSHDAIGRIVPLLSLVAYTAWFTNPEYPEARERVGAILQRLAWLTLLPLLCGALRELFAHASVFAGESSTGLPAALQWQASAGAWGGLLIAQRAPFVFFALALLLALLRLRQPSDAPSKTSEPA